MQTIHLDGYSDVWYQVHKQIYTGWIKQPLNKYTAQLEEAQPLLNIKQTNGLSQTMRKNWNNS